MQKLTFLVLISFFLICSKGTGQDETTGEKKSVLSSNQKTVEFLVVPMMDKMFLSNVSHEIGKYNQMNFREVRAHFIEKLNETTVLSGFDHWNMKSTDEMNDSMALMIQAATGFDYNLVTTQKREKEGRIEELWKTLQSKKDPQNLETGSYLDKGEIKEFYDGKQRFMNAKLDTAWVFGSVLKDEAFDYVILINELDINKPRPTDPNYGTNERTLKLHFTVYSGSGERIYGNATYSTFSQNVLDIHEITNNPLFSAVNRMLAECSSHLATLSTK